MPYRYIANWRAWCSRLHIYVAIVALSLCTIGVRRGAAQAVSTASAMDGRVSPKLRARVMVIVDSVTAAGLPSAPLIDKTLEGVSKGASDSRILAAVRSVAAALGQARHTLGISSDDELVAAAAALRAGVSPSSLVQMQRALAGRSLVVPLSVLSALVVQGVTPPTATSAVVAYAKRNNDGRMLAYGRNVARQIAAGVAPEVAVFDVADALGEPMALRGGLSTPATGKAKP